jgi:hypothetical protein
MKDLRGESMKKLSLICAMALVLAALCVPQVDAGDVTIPDTVIYGSAGTWYNRTPSPANPAGEDQEVEPNCVATKVWDLEGFAVGKIGVSTTAKTLYTIGTWNFTNGEPGDPKGGNWTSGDIFISIGSKPVYGTQASGSSSVGGDSNMEISNTFKYNYVLDMHWTAGTFDIYAIDNDTLLSVYYDQNDESNPYKYVSGGTKINQNGALSFSYLTGTVGLNKALTDAEVLAQYGVTATDGTHNVVGTDLSTIWNGYDEIWFHFTQECGNDNLMGYQARDIHAPVPPSALLLGTGLLGLVGLRWRRRQSS